MTVLLKTVHEEDPRQKLLNDIGDLSELNLFHNNVLVALYLRPDTGELGGKPFYLADKTRDEDKYQGIVGLVVKKGPAAFVEDANQRFYGCNVEVGDWVFFRASDGLLTKVKGVFCRRFADTDIQGTVPEPGYVY